MRTRVSSGRLLSFSMVLLATLLVCCGDSMSPRGHEGTVMPAVAYPQTAAGTPVIDEAAREAGVTEDWLCATLAQIELDEYNVSESDRGLQAPNRAQDLRTYFREDGIEVVPRTGDVNGAWRLSWRTLGWGRGEVLTEVDDQPDELRVDGARVQYCRDGLEEWYENKKEGLEQGFRLTAKPEGEGLLRIEGLVDGNLIPKFDPEQGAVDFLDEDGVTALRYAGLQVYDARGKTVPSRLAMDADRIVITVDDAHAQYPILIDPFMNTPPWTGEANQDSASFGWSVGTAGDVNRDGYSDVIVGAYLYDIGGYEVGKVYVYHGSSSGLTGPEWTEAMEAPNSWFGYSVGTAGDVNGDGFYDVIIGAPRIKVFLYEYGAAYVYYGSLSGLSDTSSWHIVGNHVNARVGQSVGTAGDVNGDGYDDVIVGAPRFGYGGTEVGCAFVYQGADTGLVTTAAWTAESDQDDSWFGQSVGTAGDVNGDGYDDVVVGAYQYDNGQTDEGRVYVYHGSSVGLYAAAAWTTESNQTGAWFGYSVGTAGDVNGDGYADLVVGAPRYNGGFAEEGRAYVYNGSSTGLSGGAAWTDKADQAGAHFGVSVGTAGDVNGDGCADIVVGADTQERLSYTDEGCAYVYTGTTAGLLTSPVWKAAGGQNNAHFGASVATAGDINGDGYSDVIVGAFGYDNGQTDEGRAYVFRGEPGGLWGDVEVEGNQASANFGVSVGTAGDVNGDGYSDVIIGAPMYDNGEADEGRAFVYHGAFTGLSGTPAWTAEGNQASANFGISVGTAGDVNGDGYSDVIVGAYYYDNVQVDEGRALVYHGSVSGLSGTAAWTAELDQAGAHFGRAVGTAGDVNGDGYSDVIVGAYDYDNGEADEGGAFVYHGSAFGLSGTAAWTAEGDQVASAFGGAVGTAGDVNGDGYSDVIVGAYGYDGGITDEGRTYVYHGSSGGLSAVPAWTAESDQATSRFGFAVGTAGDVNGDGYSDVIVGAYFFDNAMTNEGQVFVYHGSSGGLSAVPAWTRAGAQPTARFGSSVGTAGDINADGYSDIIVGAHTYDSYLHTDDGMVYVFFGSSGGITSYGMVEFGTGQDYARSGCSVGTAGDVNGDGFWDVIVGADMYDGGETDEGAVMVLLGNWGYGGRHRIPRQLQVDSYEPIAALGMSRSSDRFVLRILGRTPAGRGIVNLQCEVKPFGTPFNGTGVVTVWQEDTGAPSGGESVVPLEYIKHSLSSNTLYHWRVRVLTDSPFFPRSPWFSPAFNGVAEADLRIGIPIAVAEQEPVPGALLLGAAAPNPFEEGVQLRYSLPARGCVRLAVYDVAGRELALLKDAVEDAGPHIQGWNGRGAKGEKLGAGVYFVRLEFGGRKESQKVVLAR